MALGLGVGARQQQTPVRDIGIPGPDLVSVHHIVVTLAGGGGGQRGQIRAGAGLAETLAPPLGAVDDAGQETLSQFIAANATVLQQYLTGSPTVLQQYLASSPTALEAYLAQNATALAQYIAAFEKMANLGTKAAVEGRLRIRIHTPLIALSKAGIVELAQELGVDFSLTHSCYDPDAAGRPCGQCDSCLLRRKGFEEAGIADR